jgi:transposase
VPELLVDVKFLEQLFLEDSKEAGRTRSLGCPHCGGRLHQAHYPRKVRGVTEQAAEFFDRRFSFCCARCRKRQTPPSLRFQSRAVYAAVAVLCAGVIAVQRSLAEAVRQLGAARRTVRRWRQWFRQLPSSGWWKRQSGQFREVPEAKRLPLSLLEQIAGATQAERALRALRLLSGARFPMVDTFTQRMPSSAERSAP